ncbi:hypothetical protein FISHEDRAFT_50806 [Fistulina hepatica ATCC 64428]|uniref:Phytanoyl-CoA dioxygenase n=1 Tax=Fistulina hepatica ATCC 64428 TaxID=1128425 RepID=A0A0D7A419_9AGAR|nr:hypothetical protein FISHEDRAFT_50806 [Fistulina hepatica ATCC 64428]
MSNIKQAYDEQGFVVVENTVPPEMRQALECACERVISRTRNGEWPYRRTVGTQFPPFDDATPTDYWGVQHVMHPDLHEPIFARWYTSSALLDPVKELLGCQDDDLQMELFNLLINPTAHDFALRWHRDDVRLEKASDEEERKALDAWHYGVQWNTALYRDSCLFVVPGSHKIPRTPEQRVLSSGGDAPKNPLDMPGAIRLTLNPGETVFYNSNILHCAAYDSQQKRATLHACIGDRRGGTTRARNVLQHGLEWMKGTEFRETLDAKGQQMLDSLLKLQEKTGGEVVYSQNNEIEK